MSSQQRSSLESTTQEESDNEDIQFVDVVDILKAQDSNKGNKILYCYLKNFFLIIIF